MKYLFSIIIFFLTFSYLFGQCVNEILIEAKPWIPNKENVEWRSFKTCTIENLAGYSPVSDLNTNVYGSWLNNRQEITGFYHVKKINGRWWVVDPDGYLNIQTTINSLRPGTSERNKKYFSEKFGTLEKWIQVTADSLFHFGFAGVGSWSNNNIVIKNNKISKKQLSYTPNLNFMSNYGKKRGGTYQLPGNTGYPNQCIFVFDPEFEMFCDEHAKQLIVFQDDKNMFGIFSDNELPISLKNLEGYLSLDNKNDPGYIAASNWLKSIGKTKDDITDDDRAAFAGFVADRYYKIVSTAIKKYAPNHMFIGSRLHSSAKKIKEIITSAGKYCDVLSFNYYGVWTPEKDLMEQWEELSNKPFIITEFYTKSMDSGLANTTGAGFTVKTQKDKGYAYQNFCLSLLKSRACVGWHYFKYQDNDPTATDVDPSNIDSNKGILNNLYEYYYPLMPMMKELHDNRYKLTEYFDKSVNQ